MIYKDLPYNKYALKPKPLSAKERELARVLSSLLQRKSPLSSASFQSLTETESTPIIEGLRDFLQRVPSHLLETLPSSEEQKNLEKLVSSFFDKTALFVHDSKALAKEVIELSFGYGRLTPLVSDDDLEEIMFNKVNAPLFAYHRRHGLCQVQLSLDKDEVGTLIERIARFAGKEVSERYPLLEANFPDGSRINVTVPPASPKSPSITIRKFTKSPVTLLDLIQNNTFNLEIAAFLWAAVEGFSLYPLNVLVCGSTGAGKTTLLNALSVFVPKSDRIVSVEDTLELQLWGKENWVQMQSRPGYKESPDLTMNDLLKSSLRMRPDRIIVGEVRGAEAQTMFTAMNVGHRGSMGTLHSNSAAETVLRLTGEPMNVPKNMMTLVDLIVVIHRIYSRQKGLIRRVFEVSEVTRGDQGVALSPLYSWDYGTDSIKKQDIPSQSIEKLSKYTGRSKKEVEMEIGRRQAVLEWMISKKINSVEGIDTVVQAYYTHPSVVFDQMNKE